MARRNTKEDTQTTAFKAAETELKTKIAEATKITDPAEQLLRYAALKKYAASAYDQEKVKLPARDEYLKSADIQGGAAGVVLGPVATIGALFAIAFSPIGLIAFPVALGYVVTIAAVAAVIGSRFGGAHFGAKIGRKIGLHHYNKTHPADVEHATNMSVLAQSIDTAIGRVETSLMQKENLAALTRSPRYEEVLKASPAIAQEADRLAKNFRHVAKIAAKQKALQKPGAASRSAANLKGA